MIGNVRYVAHTYDIFSINIKFKNFSTLIRVYSTRVTSKSIESSEKTIQQSPLTSIDWKIAPIYLVFNILEGLASKIHMRTS